MSGKAMHVVLTALILFGAPPVLAEAADHDAGAAHAGSHEYHPNTLGLFMGVTAEGREEDVTLGIEYERRFNRSFGIGVVGEHVFGDLDFWVYALPFAYHNEPWKFYAAPGVQDGDEGSEFLARVGVEYAFEVGDVELSPQLNVDFVDGEEVWVAGLLIGKGF